MKLTDITILVDKSGSMYSLQEDTIGGINKFVEDQVVEGDDANLSLYQFANDFEITFDALKITEVPTISETDYVANGRSTSLLDGIGRTITAVSDRQAKMKEEDRPDKTIVVIMTDGGENSSREFAKKAVADMIAKKETDDEWQFLFLGSDMSGISDAQDLGFTAGRTMKNSKTKYGTQTMHSAVSKGVKKLRGMSGQAYSASIKDTAFDLYDADDRKEADKDG